MFGIGLFEFLLIALAVLLFIKPKDLPSFFRRAGKVYREMRDMYLKAMNYLDHISREVENFNLKKPPSNTRKFIAKTTTKKSLASASSKKKPKRVKKKLASPTPSMPRLKSHLQKNSSTKIPAKIPTKNKKSSLSGPSKVSTGKKASKSQKARSKAPSKAKKI